MRFRLMASYRGASYQSAVGPSDWDVTLFAAVPPPEKHEFSPAPGGIWRKQVRLDELDRLWESRPIGSYKGDPCLVLDDLGDRLHIVYLGMGGRRAAQLNYWEVDRDVFEVVVSKSDVTDLAEERLEFPLTPLISALQSAVGLAEADTSDTGQTVPAEPARGDDAIASSPALPTSEPAKTGRNRLRAVGRHRGLPPASSSPLPGPGLAAGGKKYTGDPSSPFSIQSAAVKAGADSGASHLVAAELPDDTPAIFDLAIRHSGAPGEFGVEVLASDTGEAKTTIKIDLDELLARQDGIQLAVLASAVTSRRILPETEKPIREVGQLLFKALLGTGDVAGQYRAATALAAGRGQRLRISLRIDAPEIAALPWEAMYDDTIRSYVCREGQLIRHVGVARVPAPLLVRPPMRILGVVSSPRGRQQLNVEEEQQVLARALSRPVSQGLVEMHWAPAATWEDLHSLLLGGPWHVVHYIGHGDFDPEQDEGYLVLVDDDGRPHHVAAHRLVDLLRQASPMPRLVVLNSCLGARSSTSDLFSGTAAALAGGGVSAVAAMQFAISNRAAAAFARGFYEAIAHGRGVDAAISSGRVGILGTSDYTLEWLTPVLYLRGRDAQLFTVS